MALNIAQFRHIRKVKDRLRYFEPHGRIDLVDVKQIGLGSHKGDQGHHNRFANRVYRWVGDLRKQLFKVVVQGFVFVAEDRQWAVIAHGTQGFFAGSGHRCNQKLQVFLGEPKCLLAIEQTYSSTCSCLRIATGDVV